MDQGESFCRATSLKTISRQSIRLKIYVHLRM